MKERLIDVVRSIDSCTQACRGTRIESDGRVHCVYDDHDETFWFINPRVNNNISMRDLPQLKQYGHFVSKNTKVAIKLQSCNVGESFEHKQLDYIKRMRTHRIVLENRADFQNQKIEIAGDSLLYQYRDIHDFLSALP